jgi:hypothetical protein
MRRIPKTARALYILAMTCAGVVPCLETRASAEPKTHDGFQFRGATGAAYWWDKEDPVAFGVIGDKLRGAAGSLEVFAGGTPLRGLVIGGFYGMVMPPATTILKEDGERFDDSGSLTQRALLTAGPYVDYYPDPRKGFHVLGDVGGAVQLGAGYIARLHPPGIGYTLGAGVGYDWWVSNEWSLGLLARFQYVRGTMSGERSDLDLDIVATGLALSIEYQ